MHYHDILFQQNITTAIYRRARGGYSKESLSFHKTNNNQWIVGTLVIYLTLSANTRNIVTIAAIAVIRQTKQLGQFCFVSIDPFASFLGPF